MAKEIRYGTPWTKETGRPEIWDTYPDQYNDPQWIRLTEIIAAEEGVPRELALGILLKEKTNASLTPAPTKDNPRPTAKGPFQIIDKTSEGIKSKYKVDSRASPPDHVRAAMKLIRSHLDEYKDLPPEQRNWMAAAAYNGGPSWQKNHPGAADYANDVVSFSRPSAPSATATSTEERTGDRALGRFFAEQGVRQSVDESIQQRLTNLNTPKEERSVREEQRKRIDESIARRLAEQGVRQSVDESIASRLAEQGVRQSVDESIARRFAKSGGASEKLDEAFVSGLTPDQAALVQSIVSGSEQRAQGMRQRANEIKQRAKIGRTADPEEQDRAIIAYEKYSTASMTPEQRSQYEAGVADGAIPVPKGVVKLEYGNAAPPEKKVARQPPMLSASAVRRYIGAINNDNSVEDRFTDEQMMSLEKEVRSGNVRTPPGFPLRETSTPNFLQNFWEGITGDKREVASTEALPDWIRMPEVMQSGKAFIGSMTSLDPQEIEQVIKANAPDVTSRKDARGNIILKSANGQEYAIKPGLTLSDFARMVIPVGTGIVGTALAAPAAAALGLGGTATSILAGGAGALTGQAAVEDLRNLAGVEQTAGQSAKRMLVAGGLGAAVPGAGAVARAVRAATPSARLATQEAAERTLQQAKISQPAATAPPPIPGVTKFQAGTYGAGRGVVAAAEERPLPANLLATSANVAKSKGVNLTSTEWRTIMMDAARAKSAGDRYRAITRFAEAVDADAETVEAAARLGVLEYLQPDHVSSSVAGKQLIQSIKAIPGSITSQKEKENVKAIISNAINKMEEMGGTRDLASIGPEVRTSIEQSANLLRDESDKLYGAIRKKIGGGEEFSADNAISFIKNRMSTRQKVSDNVSKLEQMVLRKLSPKISEDKTILPTYDIIDDVRKEVGAATSVFGEFASTDRGIVDGLYSALLDDQRAIAASRGLADTFDAARSAVKARKGLEDDLVAIFGEKLSNSIATKIAPAVRMSLASGDVETLQNLINAVPSDMRKKVIMSGVITAFGSFQGDLATMNAFTKWYEGILRNKRAQAMLFSNLEPGAKQNFDDVHRVFKSVSSSMQERRNTGLMGVSQKEFENIPAENVLSRVLAATAGGVKLGTAITMSRFGVGGQVAASMLSGLARDKRSALAAADDLLASKELQDLFQEQMRNSIRPTTIRRVATSQKFKDWIKSIEIEKRPSTLSEREKFINNFILQPLPEAMGYGTEPSMQEAQQ